MVQFSKKVLATWAAVVVAEEIDLNLEAEKTVEVPVEEVSNIDLNLDADADVEVPAEEVESLDEDEEEFDMDMVEDAGQDPDFASIGHDLFGAFGGPPSEETKQTFAEYDTDSDGKLSNNEFAKFLGEKMWEMSADQRGGKEYIEVANVTEAEEAEGMKRIDTNGDGQVTREEYVSGMHSVNDDGLIKMLDSNKSGGLEIQEFGFVVKMFGMTAENPKEEHDHAHDHAAHGDDHDHSQCSGHHGEEADVHEQEEIASNEQADIEAPATSAQCQGKCQNETIVEEIKAPVEGQADAPSCGAKCNETTSEEPVVSDAVPGKAEEL